MELKNYQKKAMRDIASYLAILNQDNNILSAWQHYWASQDIHVGYGGVCRCPGVKAGEYGQTPCCGV